MIRHAVKLIRKQWNKNIWIILELFIVLSLMWYMVDTFSVMWINSRTPVGFDIKDTYLVNVVSYQAENPRYINYPEGSEEPGQNYLRILEQLRNHPDVVGVSMGKWHYPYFQGSMNYGFRHDSINEVAQIYRVIPDYFDVFNVCPDGGGSSSQLSEALQDGVILSKTFREKLIPQGQAVGQNILNYDSTATYRVNGVTTLMKEHLFRRPKSYIYLPFRENDLIGQNDRQIVGNTDICIRTRPGFNEADFAAAFKDEMNQRLAIGNFYLADVVPLSQAKEDMLKWQGIYESIQNGTALIIFFLFNIFLGVLGTFWLRIEKRKEEIGLRMAVGSARSTIMRQMLTESLILLCIALIPAVIVWMNIVVMDILPADHADVDCRRLALNTLFTLAPLTVIILLATWYPARKSARLHPADALHYE